MPSRQEEPSGSFFVSHADGDDAQPAHPADDATWVAHCDGGAWPNPGTMALGAVLTSPNGEVHHLSQRLSGSGCNNEAEWRATVALLGLALQHGARSLHLHTDSTQVRDHLSQADAPALPPALQTWVNEARAQAARLTHFSVQWVPRHRNAQADALAREALGLPPKPVQVPHPKARRRG
ncbi:ribonuclease HI family protein [Aquabacterium sp. UBA2148]|uniref:ribonuclease HI family protein n=1 Tax=Aquabacterium sp. UBA2148 TaxID=1946042 RepID=UPI00257F2E8A|nr:ribonuclease HI family protein [Aquabacterium sp. UBA2148]